MVKILPNTVQDAKFGLEANLPNAESSIDNLPEYYEEALKKTKQNRTSGEQLLNEEAASEDSLSLDDDPKYRRDRMDFIFRKLAIIGIQNQDSEEALKLKEELYILLEKHTGKEITNYKKNAVSEAFKKGLVWNNPLDMDRDRNFEISDLINSWSQDLEGTDKTFNDLVRIIRERGRESLTNDDEVFELKQKLYRELEKATGGISTGSRRGLVNRYLNVIYNQNPNFLDLVNAWDRNVKSRDGVEGHLQKLVDEVRKSGLGEEELKMDPGSQLQIINLMLEKYSGKRADRDLLIKFVLEKANDPKKPDGVDIEELKEYLLKNESN